MPLNGCGARAKPAASRRSLRGSATAERPWEHPPRRCLAWRSCVRRLEPCLSSPVGHRTRPFPACRHTCRGGLCGRNNQYGSCCSFSSNRGGRCGLPARSCPLPAHWRCHDCRVTTARCRRGGVLDRSRSGWSARGGVLPRAVRSAFRETRELLKSVAEQRGSLTFVPHGAQRGVEFLAERPTALPILDKAAARWIVSSERKCCSSSWAACSVTASMGRRCIPPRSCSACWCSSASTLMRCSVRRSSTRSNPLEMTRSSRSVSQAVASTPQRRRPGPEPWMRWHHPMREVMPRLRRACRHAWES